MKTVLEDDYDIRIVQELLGHNRCEHDDDLHSGVEPEPTRGE